MAPVRNRLERINRSIFLLWTGHIISHAGDAIYQISLPWLILELTGSKTATSLVALSAYLPAVLFSLPAGVVVDQFDRRRVMILSDAARMVLMGLLVMFLLRGGSSPAVIGVIAFSVAAFATLFYPARDALIPDLVPKDGLTSANAFISTSGQLAHLAGPVLAASLVTLVGITHLFTIDALSFGASMVSIALIARIIPRESTGQTRAKHLRDLQRGIRYALSERALGALVLLTAVNNLFIMGPAMIGTPIFVREVLRMDFVAFATIEAFMAAGMLIGSFIVWRFFREINPSLILFLGMIVDGLSYSLLYMVHTYSATKILLLIHGTGIPMITISRTTIIQRVVPHELRGRIFSMVNMSVIGFTALSSGLVGPVAEMVPIPTVFLIIGVGASLCGVAGLTHRGMMSLGKY
ncbi:MAG: MFS transporter [Fidelibacterota bacterium]